MPVLTFGSRLSEANLRSPRLLYKPKEPRAVKLMPSSKIISDVRSNLRSPKKNPSGPPIWDLKDGSISQKNDGLLISP